MKPLTSSSYSLDTKWIVFVYISIFVNSLVLFTSPFEFYIGYLAYFILMPSLLKEIAVPRPFFFFFAFLFIYGLIHVFLGNNEFGQFIKVFFGVFLSYSFYYLFIVKMKINIEQLFKWYLKGCYIVAVIGLFQLLSWVLGIQYGYDYGFILNKWGTPLGGNFGLRVNSIFGEPSYYAMFMSSSIFIAMYSLFVKDAYYYKKHQSIIVIISTLLSFSSAGYLGFLLAIVLLMVNFGFVRSFVLFVPILLVVSFYMYNNVEEFRTRIDSTLAIFQGGDFKVGETHGSSIVLYNNFHIAVENFKDYPLGTGLGAHPTAFDKHSLTKHIRIKGFDLNKQDANSMFNRLLSETGLLGVGLYILIMIRFYVNRNVSNPHPDNSYWLISNAILVMMLVYFFRQGHYFLNGFPFFVWLYYFNSKKYKESLTEINTDIVAK